MSVAHDTLMADQCRELRQDLMNLRRENEALASDRDAWRLRATDAAFRLEQLKFAILRLCKEAQ